MNVLHGNHATAVNKEFLGLLFKTKKQHTKPVPLNSQFAIRSGAAIVYNLFPKPQTESYKTS
jgi:hypothetical protein